MENLEQEKISKVKSKFEKEHTKISVFLRFDQIEYLNKEHVEPNCSNMSLVVRFEVLSSFDNCFNESFFSIATLFLCSVLNSLKSTFFLNIGPSRRIAFSDPSGINEI